jgi:hypothetical protein
MKTAMKKTTYSVSFVVCRDPADPTKVRIRKLTGTTVSQPEGFKKTDVYYAIYDADPTPVPPSPNQLGHPTAQKPIVTNGIWAQTQDIIYDDPCLEGGPEKLEKWIVVYHHFQAEGSSFQFFLPEIVPVNQSCPIDDACP